MAKENTFLKNLSGISNAITSVTEIIGDRKSGGTSKKAMDEDAEDNSIKIIVDRAVAEKVKNKISPDVSGDFCSFDRIRQYLIFCRKKQEFQNLRVKKLLLHFF